MMQSEIRTICAAHEAALVRMGESVAANLGEQVVQTLLVYSRPLWLYLNFCRTKNWQVSKQTWRHRFLELLYLLALPQPFGHTLAALSWFRYKLLSWRPSLFTQPYGR